MNKPLVSVILPTYNRSKLISRAIKSVLKQTYNNFELIIIDDGSTDNTSKVIRKIKDIRIKYIQRTQNKGQAAARNTGLKLARGEYIAFHDSDDEWLPNKLEQHMLAFHDLSPRYGVVYSGYWRVSKGEKTYLPLRNLSRKETDIHQNLLATSFVTMVTIVCKKECFSQVGLFDEKLLRHEDWELAIRLAKQYLFKYIDKALVVVHAQPINSVSNNIDTLIESLQMILDRHVGEYNNNKRALGKRLIILADAIARQGNEEKSKAIYKKGLHLNKSIKYLLSYLLLLVFGIHFYNTIMNKLIKYT